MHSKPNHEAASWKDDIHMDGLYGFVRHPETNETFGWAQDGFVFDIETRKRKMFALRGSDLYSLNGESLDLHLKNTEGGDLRMAGGGNQPVALAKFQELLDSAGSQQDNP
jgi:hypothetical protein